MNKMLKPLAIAATLIATLAPASAAEPTTADPAYRVMTVYTLYGKLQQCDNIDPLRAEAVTVAIVNKAKSEAPYIDAGYLWRKAQTGPYMGQPSREDCKVYCQNLLDIANGAVFQ